MTAGDEKRREANVSVKIKRTRLILFRKTSSSNANLKTVMAPKQIREGSCCFFFTSAACQPAQTAGSNLNLRLLFSTGWHFGNP